MQIDGIKGYRENKPSIVLVSSSAVERNAIIGDDAEARKQDIPIVQLNPGGILNFKYMGEMAVRESGLPYSIIRPVGRPLFIIHFIGKMLPSMMFSLTLPCMKHFFLSGFCILSVWCKHPGWWQCIQ